MNPYLQLAPHHRITLRMPSRFARLLKGDKLRVNKKKGALEACFDTLDPEQSKQLIQWAIRKFERAPGTIQEVALQIEAFLYDSDRMLSQHEPFFDLLEVPLCSGCITDFLSRTQKANKRGREAYHLILYYTAEHQKQNYDRLIEQAMGLNSDAMSSEACVCFTLPVGSDIEEALERAGSAAPPATLFGLYQPLYDSNGLYMDDRAIFQQKSIKPWAAAAKARKERNTLDANTIRADEGGGIRRL